MPLFVINNDIIKSNLKKVTYKADVETFIFKFNHYFYVCIMESCVYICNIMIILYTYVCNKN